MRDLELKNTFLNLSPQETAPTRRALSAPARTAFLEHPQERSATTFIAKGLGRSATVDIVMKDMEAKGLAGLFDFVYVPMIVREGRAISRGLAVVNFTDPGAVHRWQPTGVKGRPSEVRPARLQGARLNVEEFWAKVAERGLEPFEHELSRPWVTSQVVGDSRMRVV